MKIHSIVLAASAAFLLSACSGNGSSEPGIEVSLKAQVQGTPHHDHGGGAPATTAVFRRDDGMKIELELGLLNLVPIELQKCGTSVSAARLLDALNPIGSALAHAGEDHGGEPPEGAVSVIPSDGGEFDLGTLAAAPGRYCGVVVELQPGAAGAVPKHGDELDVDMTNTLVNVAPCYYNGTQDLSDAQALAASAHSCVQVKVQTAARRLTLPFAAPVTLDGGNKSLALSVVTRYEEWFNGVDFATLAGNSLEQAKLLDNIAASLYVVTGAEQNVALGFKLQVNGEEAVCGKVYEGLGTTAQPMRVEGFRFYASNFALQNAAGSVPVRLDTQANGTVYQDDSTGIALIGHTQGCDAPVRVRNLVLTGTAPKGDYDQVCFDLGVPYSQAHSDPSTAPSPLNVTGMDWSWLFGRMFFRFDSVVGASVNDTGNTDPHAGGGDTESQTFFLHLGSTGCSNGASPDFGAPPTEECVYPNRPRICLPYADIAEGHSIVADIAPLVSELDITVNTPDTAPGCMSFESDPECVTVMPQYGLDYALNPPALIPRREQTLFTVGE